MEHVICNLCGADAFVPLLHRADRFTGRMFQYVTCSRCGLIYLNPRPTQTELSAFYPTNYEAYYTINERMFPLERWQRQRALDVQLDFIERFAPLRGRLLDIGCGTGSFLLRARERGWDIKGVEWAEKAVWLARKNHNLNILAGSIEEVLLPEAETNVITLWDVLEHLPDPRKTLGECGRLLSPVGVLVFSVPNLSSFTRYIFGHAWIGWDAPRHLYLFTEPIIKQLLEQSGFTFVGKYCILGEEGALALSLEYMLGTSKVRRALGVVAALLWPYRQIAYLLNRGAVVTFVARKIL